MTSKKLIIRLMACLIIIASIILSSKPCDAEIIIKDVWARASSSKNDNASMYFTITNTGIEDDALTGIDTDISVDAMIHETVIRTVEGKQRIHMRMLNKLDLPAEKTIILAPFSYHIMLSRLNTVLVVGHTFNVTFRFAQHAPIASVVTIEEAGADKYVNKNN